MKPIHKKGPINSCIYRALSLISHAPLHLTTTSTKLASWQIAPEQIGIVKGRGTKK